MQTAVEGVMPDGPLEEHRATARWQVIPTSVNAACLMLFLDAAVTWAAAFLIAAPIVVSRLSGLETMPHTSAQAPMVWDALSPALIGTGIALALASLQTWFGVVVRRGAMWARVAASLTMVAGVVFALTPWSAFQFPAYVYAIKPALLLAALGLLWLPQVSREFFRAER